MFSLPSQLGYGALFGLVVVESAGVPVPGETALLTAGVLAAAGHLALPIVILVAAGAAILGDGLGYWLGRKGGRAALLRRGPFAGHRAHAVERGEAFFARYGAKTVFLARWIPGVRGRRGDGGRERDAMAGLRRLQRGGRGRLGRLGGGPGRPRRTGRPRRVLHRGAGPRRPVRGRARPAGASSWPNALAGPAGVSA